MRLTLGNASGGFMAVENTLLLWEFSTGKQRRHNIPFSDMRFGERRETSCSSVWEGIGHGDLPLTGGVDAGEAGREGKQ